MRLTQCTYVFAPGRSAVVRSVVQVRKQCDKYWCGAIGALWVGFQSVVSLTYLTTKPMEEMPSVTLRAPTQSREALRTFHHLSNDLFFSRAFIFQSQQHLA